ncbi:MAG: hypothetical protein GX896_09540, partial [Clostridiales bacterium]|nr:hypothetical protein [Clostridiales bacterium]
NQSLSPKFELIRAFIIAITAISSVFLGCSYIDLDINYFVVAIYGLLLTALYCCFNFVSNKNKKFVSISIIAHALIMAMFTKKFWSGFLVIIDSYFIEIEQSTQFSETVSDISSEYWYATVAVMLIITILIAVLSLACYYKNNFLVLFLLTFPFFELGAFWGLVPNYFFFTVLMICWVSTFAMQLANWNWIHIKGKSAFTLKPNSAKFYISSKQLIRHSSSIIVFTVSAISVATVAGILLLAAVFGYERPSSVNELRYKIKMAVEDFSFDNYSNFFSYFDSEFDFLPTKSVGGTNGGKLGRSDKIIFSGKDALKIISPKSVGPLYLKGYCAGDYTGKSWDQFDFSVYEKYEATFNEKNKTVFQNYNYDACSILINKDITGNIDTNLFEVEVKNASKKYYYAPYFTNYSDATNSNPNMETTVLAKDTEYEIPYYNFQDNENNNNALKYYSAYYNNLITNELYKLNHDYSNYADFVKANYCDINFSVVEEAYNDIVRNYLYINDDYDYY